jgi:hypothetical protein
MTIMQRSDVLWSLLRGGAEAARCAEVAAELGLPEADMLVVAGLPVPERLLPPEREGLREFAYRVTYCDHEQLTALTEFIVELPDLRLAGQGVWMGPSKYVRPDPEDFARVLDGLIANRGFTVRQLPFTGLSRATIHGMLSTVRQGRFWSQSVHAMAGVLGWAFEDLGAIAKVELSGFDACGELCRHVGQVFTAAVPLTTEQLALATAEADRLSARRDQGAWRPVVYGRIRECPVDGRRPQPMP